MPWLLLPMLAVLAGADPVLELAVSMHGGGVSAQPTRMLLPDLAARLDPPAVPLDVAYTALEQGGCLVLAPAGENLAALRLLWSDRHREPAETGPVSVAVSAQDLLVDASPSGTTADELVTRAATWPGAPRVERVGATWTRIRKGAHQVLLVRMEGCTDTVVADRVLEHWEIRSVTRMQRRMPGGGTQVVHVVSQPLGEGARRHHALMEARRRAEEEGRAFLEILAGDEVESASYLRRRSNIHRVVTEEALAERRPAVMVPQGAELHEGLDAFLALAARVGAVPVSANLRRADGRAAMRAWVHVDVAGRDVVVVGVTRPGERAELPAEVQRQLRVDPPAAAVAAAIQDAARTLGRWPHLVVVAGELEGADAHEVATLPGVDLAYVSHGKHVDAVRVVVEPAPAFGRADRLPVLAPGLSRYRLEQTRVVLGQDGPRAVEHLSTPITLDLPVPPTIRDRVQALRQPLYVDGDREVVPARPLPESATPTERARDAREHYGAVVGALVQDRTRADVVVLPPPRESWGGAGGFSRLRLQAAVAGQDRLVALLVGADALRALPRRAAVLGMSVTGMKDGQVLGRTLDARERYLVVTTEAAALALEIEDDIVARRFLDVPGRLLPVPGPLGGEPVLLRDLVLGGVEDLQRMDPAHRAAAFNALAGPRGGSARTRLVLEARDVTLSFSGYDVNGNERYPGVPYWRVLTPDNRAFLGSGLLRAAVEGPLFSVEARFQARWDRIVLAERTVVDRANFWNAGLEARVPRAGVRLPVMGGRVEPFLARSAESQFFAIPRLPELVEKEGPFFFFGRTNAGVAILDVGPLREWRISGVIQEDIMRMPQSWRERRPYAFQPGVESSGLLAYTAGPLSLEVTHAWRYLVPRPGLDSSRELSLTALTRAAVKATILPGLAVTSFADGFVFLGPQPGARPGYSYTMGLGLALDRTYKPLTELGWLW